MGWFQLHVLEEIMHMHIIRVALSFSRLVPSSISCSVGLQLSCYVVSIRYSPPLQRTDVPFVL